MSKDVEESTNLNKFLNQLYDYRKNNIEVRSLLRRKNRSENCSCLYSVNQLMCTPINKNNVNVLIVNNNS